MNEKTKLREVCTLEKGTTRHLTMVENRQI